MASRCDSLSTSEVCNLLKTSGLDDEVVEIFRANKIDGGTLLELNSDDLKELGIVALGDRKRLQKVITAETADIAGTCTAASSSKADISTRNCKVN